MLFVLFLINRFKCNDLNEDFTNQDQKNSSDGIIVTNDPKENIINTLDRNIIYINFIKKLFRSQPNLMNKLINFETNNLEKFKIDEVYEIIINGIDRIQPSGDILSLLCSLFIYDEYFSDFLDIYLEKITNLLEHLEFSLEDVKDLEDFYALRNYRNMKKKVSQIINKLPRMKTRGSLKIIFHKLTEIEILELSLDSFILCCVENFIFRMKHNDTIISDFFISNEKNENKHIFVFDIENYQRNIFCEYSNICIFYLCTNYHTYINKIKTKSKNLKKLIVDIGNFLQIQYFSGSDFFDFFKFFNLLIRELKNFKNYEFQCYNFYFRENNENDGIEIEYCNNMIIYRLIRSHIRKIYIKDFSAKKFELHFHNITKNILQVYVKIQKELEQKNRRIDIQQYTSRDFLNSPIYKIYESIDLKILKINADENIEVIRINDFDLFQSWILKHNHMMFLKKDKIYILEIESNNSLEYIQENALDIFMFCLKDIYIFGMLQKLEIIGSFKIDAFIYRDFKHVRISKNSETWKVQDIRLSKNIIPDSDVIGDIYLQSKILNLNIGNIMILESKITNFQDESNPSFYNNEKKIKIVDLICSTNHFPKNKSKISIKDCKIKSMIDDIMNLLFFPETETLKVVSTIFKNRVVINQKIEKIYFGISIFESQIVFDKSAKKSDLRIVNCIGDIFIEDFTLSNLRSDDDVIISCIFARNRQKFFCSDYLIAGLVEFGYGISQIIIIRCNFENKVVIQLNLEIKNIFIDQSEGNLEIISDDPSSNFGSIFFIEGGYFQTYESNSKKYCVLLNLNFKKNPRDIVELYYNSGGIIMMNIGYYNDNDEIEYLDDKISDFNLYELV